MTLEVLVVMIFLAAVAAVVGVYILMVGRAETALRQQVEGRLQEMTEAAPVPESSLVKTVTPGPLPALDRLATGTSTGSGFERWLAQTGAKTSVSGVALAAVGSTLGLGLLGALAGHWIAPIVGGVIGAIAPFVVLARRRSKRLYRFEEHFPEALDLMSRAVRAGHAFSAALKMIGDEVDAPVGPEFRATFDEQNFGLPLADALDHLSQRVPLLDVRFFVTAVLIQHDTGGNLAEILDNLAGVVRERFKIRRQVRVHTAHGRMTGYVLLALPVFLIVALSFINPDHVRLLFQERMGQTMLAGAVVMQTLGFLWIRQVVKIEV